jgi:hypothetical protein
LASFGNFTAVARRRLGHKRPFGFYPGAPAAQATFAAHRIRKAPRIACIAVHFHRVLLRKSLIHKPYLASFGNFTANGSAFSLIVPDNRLLRLTSTYLLYAPKLQALSDPALSRSTFSRRC